MADIAPAQLVCLSCGAPKDRPGLGYPCPSCHDHDPTWLPYGQYQAKQRPPRADQDKPLITGTPSWEASTSAEGAPPEGPPEASLDQGRRPWESSSQRPPCEGRNGGPPAGSKRREEAEARSPSWYDGLVVPPCANGQILHLHCNGCGHVHPVPITCKRRTCSSCAHARYKQKLAQYGELCREADYPKMLTLTLKRGENPRQLVSWILYCFQLLRRRQIWQHQEGGAYFLEGKPPNGDGTGWNVHLHVLVDGPPMPQAVLSQVWQELTEDSFIVDIRKVSQEAGLAYALGYALKGSKIKATWEDATEEERLAWEAAVKGRRLVQTFGSWHGEIADDDGKTCPECGSTSWSILEFDGEGGYLIAQQMGLSLWSLPVTHKSGQLQLSHAWGEDAAQA